MPMTAPNGLTLAAPGMTPNTWTQSPMPLSNMPGAVLCAVQAELGLKWIEDIEELVVDKTNSFLEKKSCSSFCW